MRLRPFNGRESAVNASGGGELKDQTPRLYTPRNPRGRNFRRPRGVHVLLFIRQLSIPDTVPHYAACTVTFFKFALISIGTS